MNLNAETIQVVPFNQEKLSQHFSKFIQLGENQSFIIDKDSVFISEKDSLLIDSECCAGHLDKKVNPETKNIEWVATLGVRRSTKTEEGESFPMSYECYLDVYESEFPALTDDHTSLSEFMGGRYNYNPRIVSNTREIVKLINEIVG